MKKTSDLFTILKGSKWKYLIFLEILRKGETPRSNLKEIKDTKTGDPITEKMLWETTKTLIEKEIIEEIPSTGRGTVYALSPKFREKKLNQFIYLISKEKDKTLSDTLNFQHTVYGLPEFDEIQEEEKKIVLKSLQQIDDALSNLKRVENVSDVDIALLSTYPINRTKEVRENIELTLDELFKGESQFVTKKYGERLAFGNLVRLERVIIFGRLCHNGSWIDDELSKYKFLYHKKLRENYSEEEIKFMLSLIIEIVKNYKIIHPSEMDKFIIFKGFSEGGLWHGNNKKYFYKIAEDAVKSMDTKEFYFPPGVERTERIKNFILNYPDNPPNLRDDSVTEYGLDELILYIDAKIYFEKLRVMDEKTLEL